MISTPPSFHSCEIGINEFSDDYNYDDEEEDFVCPITQEVMKDPVITSDGHTYERSAIENWLQKRPTSPLTNEELPSKLLIPNHFAKSFIKQRKTKHKGACSKLFVRKRELKSCGGDKAPVSDNQSNRSSHSTTDQVLNFFARLSRCCVSEGRTISPDSLGTLMVLKATPLTECILVYRRLDYKLVSGSLSSTHARHRAVIFLGPFNKLRVDWTSEGLIITQGDHERELFEYNSERHGRIDFELLERVPLRPDSTFRHLYEFADRHKFRPYHLLHWNCNHYAEQIFWIYKNLRGENVGGGI